MANLDTRAKRESGFGVCLSFTRVLPNPDDNDADTSFQRAHLVYNYAGIAAGLISGKSGVHRLRQAIRARDFREQDPLWQERRRKSPALTPFVVKPEAEEVRPETVRAKRKPSKVEPTPLSQPDVTKYLERQLGRATAKVAAAKAEAVRLETARLEVVRVEAVRVKAEAVRLKAVAEQEAARIEAAAVVERARVAEIARLEAERLALLADDEEAMAVILMAADIT